MNVSNLNTWLGLIGGGCAVATFLFKVWKTLNAAVETNKKRTQDLNERFDAQDMAIDEIIYYLSSEEGRKTPFNSSISLRNLRRKAIENYDGRNTSGFN
jgi:hypothetical protein